MTAVGALLVLFDRTISRITNDALLATGSSRRHAFLVASLTGAVETAAGLAGAYAVSLSLLVLNGR